MKKLKPLTVSEHIIKAKTDVMQATIGAEMALLNGKTSKEMFDLIRPILENASHSMQSASNLLHGYSAEEA